MSWLDTLAEIRKTDWTQVPEAECDATARDVIQIASYAAAAASMVPLPFADLALLLPVHSAMVMTVGHVHGRNISDAEARRVAMELGAVAGVTLAGRVALSALKKVLLPGLGGVLAAPASFAVTWALGRVANAYFKDPGLSREDLKQVFSDAFKEGKASYQEEKAQAAKEKAQEAKDKAGAPGESDGPAVDVDAVPAPEEGDEPPSRPRTKKRSM